ncbi:MAG: efflux RND transporter permease subunit [Clostridia bacterium]|nr:efflux RND transporter permease subunit [Clostridia bacterium]
MKKFFSFIIRQSVAIILIVIFVLAFGVYATVKMPVNLLPDINVPMVCVQVIYPGANATSVEKDVTEKLEENLSSIGGLTGFDSYSYDNVSAVLLSFDYGTDTTDKKSDIQEKLSSVDLPDGVTTSVYDIDLNAEALAVLSVTEEDGNLLNAYKAAKELAAQLSGIDGVESVEIKGGAETSYVISPFEGLELISPLIVQAFSYGALDIPLGNITQDGGDMQIRNNSDVTSVDDINKMPVTLPPAIVGLLTSVKQLAQMYEEQSAQDLRELETDLDGGVLAVLNDLGNMSADELDELSEYKTYINLVSGFTADELKDINKRLQRVVEDRTDEELKDLAETINDRYDLPFTITQDMLIMVRDGVLNDLIDFRKRYDDDYDFNGDDNAAYIELARYMGVCDKNEDGSPRSDEEISADADFVKKTSATGLRSIADKKRDEGDGYVPTDAECALLFTGTELSSEHPIIASPTFMAFVRSDNYKYNMSLLEERREELGEEITAAEFNALYRDLKLEGVFEFKLSEPLFDFILKTDFSGETLVTSVAEIATVKLEDSFSSYVYFGDGGAKVIKGTIIEVYKSNGANASAVVDAVKKTYTEYLGSSQSYGAKIMLLDDQSEFISDSISNVLVSMLIGGVLAILIIFVFLKKVRSSLIIAVTMPLSVLAALICLSLMGITLNMVSLGGLAVGIGMLVDNSIVVIESITKHREMDKTAYEAAVDGTTEVGGALFGSTLTTVCVFIPIIFSGGLTGEIFTDLSWAVIFSLTFSLLVAVTVIPTLYSLFSGERSLLKGGRFKKKDCPPNIPEITQKPESKFKGFVRKVKQDNVMNAVQNAYGKILPKVLGKKLITIICAVVIFGGSVGLLFLTGTEFLPSIDKGQIEVNMSYGSVSDLDEVQADVFKFASAIQSEIDNVEYVSVSVGKNGLLALTDTGIITVQLSTNRGTSKVVNKIRELSESQNFKPVGAVTVKEIDGVVASLMSGSDDMSVTIVGEDGETLKVIADEICSRLGLEENGFKDVKNSATDSAVEYDLKFDRRKMAELGIDYQTTVLTLRIGIASYTACSVTIDGESYNLNVKFDENAVKSVADLENFVVGAENDGGMKAVKLKDICGVTRIETEACIRRSNGKQMISVSASHPTLDTGSASKKLQKIAAEVLAEKAEYEGYTFESSGVSSYLTDAFEGLAVALVISFFLLYAVMAVQFGSFLKPVIVMASIPFSFTGGFIALVITGTSLNVVSFIGLIMLMGVVVNNAIVMLEKIKQLEESGMERFTAVVEACKVRLRPILMTTLTTVLALIPLAIGVGQGSELMQPLGIVVIGGLIIGTLVTLVLVPVVYCALSRVSRLKENKQKQED